MSYDGSVKISKRWRQFWIWLVLMSSVIAKLECCHTHLLNVSWEQDIRALDIVTMKLMEKDIKEDGTVEVNDLHCWPPDLNAIEFLSAITLMSSLDELKKVSLYLNLIQYLHFFTLSSICFSQSAVAARHILLSWCHSPWSLSAHSTSVWMKCLWTMLTKYVLTIFDAWCEHGSHWKFPMSFLLISHCEKNL